MATSDIARIGPPSQRELVKAARKVRGAEVKVARKMAKDAVKVYRARHPNISQYRGGNRKNSRRAFNDEMMYAFTRWRSRPKLRRPIGYIAGATATVTVSGAPHSRTDKGTTYKGFITFDGPNIAYVQSFIASGRGGEQAARAYALSFNQTTRRLPPARF